MRWTRSVDIRLRRSPSRFCGKAAKLAYGRMISAPTAHRNDEQPPLTRGLSFLGLPKMTGGEITKRQIGAPIPLSLRHLLRKCHLPRQREVNLAPTSDRLRRGGAPSPPDKFRTVLREGAEALPYNLAPTRTESVGWTFACGKAVKLAHGRMISAPTVLHRPYRRDRSDTCPYVKQAFLLEDGRAS